MANGVAPILRVSDLNIASVEDGEAETLVDGVSFELERGGALAIVGESGSGKSITAKAIASLLPTNLRACGAVEFQGREHGDDLSSLEGVRGSEIVYLPQDPFTMLNPLRRCGRQIRDSMRSVGGGGTKSVAEYLEDVEISDPGVADAFPYELSGGMQQRVSIAAALACEPALLIADEPSTALDVTTQRQVLDVLGRLRSERGMSLILITHDLRVGFEICDRAAVLYAGSVVETGSAPEINGVPAHPYTLGLLTAEPHVSRRVDLAPIEGRVPAPSEIAGKCCFVTRCPWKRPVCSAEQPALVGVGPKHDTRCARIGELREALPSALREYRGSKNARERTQADVRKPLLTVHGLSKTFYGTKRGSVTAVDGVDLAVGAGECVGLVGESGSGKTTLIRSLVRLESADTGEISLGDLRLPPRGRLDLADRRALASVVQIVYQNPYSSLNPAMTVAQNIYEAAHNVRGLQPTNVDVRYLLDRVGLPGTYADRRPRHLSGGERQRVAIARALAPDPQLLVLDEPVSALDVSVQAQILELLNELREDRGLAYLFVTHDLAVVRQVADRIYVMLRGSIVEAGSTASVLDHPKHAYTKKLLAAVYSGGGGDKHYDTGNRQSIGGVK